MEQLICQNNYILINYLSSGRFGNVYKIYDKNMGIYTALKIEKEDIIKDESLEIEIKNLIQLKKLNIHNIPKYYDSGYCDTDNKLYIEIELYDDDLKGFIEKDNNITKNQLYSIMYELLYTLSEFRMIEFEHRDIKMKNILYKIDNFSRNYIINGKNIIINNLIHPVIADFNHSGFLIDKKKSVFSLLKINFGLQDVKNLLRVFKRLIKITSNLTNYDKKNILNYIDDIELNDDESYQFLNNVLSILYNNFIK